MAVNYAKSYIDNACNSRDVFSLYNIVRALDAERDLAAPYKLFLCMWEWCCSARSGIWQYYEGVTPEEYHQIAKMMDHCELGEIATRYRAGMLNWKEPELCGDLDAWIDDNWDAIESAAMDLVCTDLECLYPEPK